MASTAIPFHFPPEYSFPPFFTPQPNATTHHAQLTKWSTLILSYARHHNLYKLSLSSLPSSDLFHNKRIDRRLSQADIKEVLEFMKKDGRAEWVREGGDVVWIWWRKVDEWARVVEDYVDGTGQKGSVLTVYELTEGDGTKGTDLHGMDTEVLIKALNVLVKRGKAQIFGQDDSQGVKFF